MSLDCRERSGTDVRNNANVYLLPTICLQIVALVKAVEKSREIRCYLFFFSSSFVAAVMFCVARRTAVIVEKNPC